ncbi:hypothetical protein HK104_005502 [Borealophlyctis nickersoniae]|nr:hypothetical protein HK104_005502 [Borealophlyctis nickersoniae]
MSISRFLPTLIRDLDREFSRAMHVFDHDPFLRRNFPSILQNTSGSSSSVMPSFRAPVVNIRETPHAYLVEAEMPGVPKSNIDVEVVGNSLVLKGHVEREAEAPAAGENVEVQTTSAVEGAPSEKTDVVKSDAEGGERAVSAEHQERTPSTTVLWKERFEGAFHRAMQFPTPVDPNGVKATFKDGLLKVTVPKGGRKGEKIAISDE